MENIKLDSEIAVTNMATTNSRDLLSEALHPGIFRRNDDLEKFLSKCNRYLDLVGIQKSIRGLVIIGLLDKDIREKYEITEDDGTGYENRMRRAFSKPKSMIRDLKEALNYRRGDEDLDIYVKRVDDLVDKLMTHKWEKEDIRKELLVHCCNDQEICRNVGMKDAGNSTEIIAEMRKFEKVRVTSEDINVVRNYKDAVTKNLEMGQRKFDKSNNFKSYESRGVENHRKFDKEIRQFNPIVRSQFNSVNSNQYIRNITCWNCNAVGHISRNCPVRNEKRCYACGMTDHLMRDCGRTKCTRCFGNGHDAKDCYTSESRIRLMKNYNQRINEVQNRKRFDEHGRRQINVVSDEKDDIELTEYDQDRQENYQELYNARLYNKDHPNGKAPSEAELIGAVY